MDSKAFRWSDWSSQVIGLNAPKEDGAKLIEPPLQLAEEMVFGESAQF